MVLDGCTERAKDQVRLADSALPRMPPTVEHVVQWFGRGAGALRRAPLATGGHA
jgi:hypothetical protein